MKRVLVITCILIFYGSLYPWNFKPGLPLADAIPHVFSAWPARLAIRDIKDIVVNLLIYLPVGFFGYLIGGPRLRLRFAMFAGTLGFLLSWSVEVLQHYVPSRQPSASDLLCNTISAFAGALLGYIYESTLRARFRGLDLAQRLRPSSALLLLMIWVAGQVLPVRLYSNFMLSKVRALLLHPAWNWNEFAVAVLAWLLGGLLLKHLMPPGAARMLLWSLIPLVTLARLISPGQPVNWPGLLGAVGGALLLFLPAVHQPSFFRPLAFAWVALILLNGLRPMQWMEVPSAFGWVPFNDMLNSAWQASIVVFLQKLWLYGAAFWLLERAGFQRFWALLAFTLSITAVEVAQRYLPGRSGGLTDPALVALASLLVWAVERKYQKDQMGPDEPARMTGKPEGSRA